MELFLITIARLLGILVGLYLNKSIVLFVVLFVILYFYGEKNRYFKLLVKKRNILLIAIIFLLSYFQIINLENKFDKKYENIQEEVNIVGTIIAEPIKKDNKTTSTLKVEQIDGDKSYKNTNLILNIKNETTIKYGNKVKIVGKIEKPEERRNTGGFSYKEYLKTKNIYAICNTYSNKIEIVKEKNINSIFITINNIKNKIIEKTSKLLDEKQANILLGILVGYKENLEENVQEAFRKSNLSHMLAVSGAHVSYIITAIGYIISKTKMNKKTGKIITIIFLAFFIVLTRANAVCYKSLHNVYLYDNSKFIS